MNPISSKSSSHFAEPPLRHCPCSEIAKKVKTAVWIAFFFLLAHSSSAFPLHNETCEWRDRPLVRQCIHPPPWADRFITPGSIYLTPNIEARIAPHVLRDPPKALSTAQYIQKSIPPEKIESLLSRVPAVPYRDNRREDGKGAIIYSNIEFYIGVPSDIVQNYRKTVQYVYDEISVKKSIFSGNPKTLISILKTAHRFLGLGETHGEIRTVEVLVAPRFTRTAEDLISVLRRGGASEEEVEIFQRTYPYVLDLPGSMENLQPEERAVWEKVFFIPVSPRQIIPSLRTLAERLPQLNPNLYEDSPLHQIRCAVEVFYAILDIHPFANGNGKIARTFLQSMLADRFGWIIFSNLLEFQRVVREGEHHHRIFEDYAVKMIRLTRKYRSDLASWEDLV